jgi:hypothetical protein
MGPGNNGAGVAHLYPLRKFPAARYAVVAGENEERTVAVQAVFQGEKVYRMQGQEPMAIYVEE